MIKSFTSNCDSHHLCECDLTISSIDPVIKPFTIARYEGATKLSLLRMYVKMLTYLTATYSYAQGSVVANVMANEIGAANLLIRVVGARQQNMIAPLFQAFNELPKLVPRVVCDWQFVIMQEFDRWYFNKCFGINIEPYRGAQDDILTVGPPPSLVKLISAQMGWTHYVFGARRGVFAWNSTREFATAFTKYELFSQFQVVNNAQHAGYQRAQRFKNAALENFLKYMLATKHLHGTLKFVYNPLVVFGDLAPYSSSGIRPGGKQKLTVVGDMPIIASNHGSKIEHIAAAIKEHQAWVRYTMDHPDDYRRLPGACVIKIKDERKCNYGKPASKINMDKKREFFIPSMVHYIHSYVLQNERMKLERGGCISVGRSWWHGGAYEFAKYLHYNRTDMTWHEGDYYMHDKHIPAWLLTFYVTQVIPYYDTQNMGLQERNVFVRFVEENVRYMVNKPTLHVGGLWQMITGVLYSGGKETSPAGSWITGICFCIFLESVKSKYPQYRAAIQLAIEKGLIRIVIYGDDHLWCVPRALSHIINETTFAKESDEMFGMKITDIMSHSQFLSTYNKRSGNLVHVGPKFLKRYFIKGERAGDPPVLPYKPTTETLQKLFAPKERHSHVAILSAIGQLWDTQFTNRVAYDCCVWYYNHLRNTTRVPLRTLLLRAKIGLDGAEANKTMNMYIRQLEVSIDLMGAGVPDYDEYRRIFHRYDKSHADFRTVHHRPIDPVIFDD